MAHDNIAFQERFLLSILACISLPFSFFVMTVPVMGVKMEIIAKLGSLFGLSFISGINLYATVAVVGFCSKFNLVHGLPPELSVLGNDVVIFIAVFLYLLEFFADKIPGLDTLWDSIHTLIRPLGGAMLAVMQVGEASPALEVIVFMLGASLASAAHITKAGTRLIVNTSPEPFSNILISLGEDVGAVGFAYLCLAHPVLSFFLTLVCLGIILLVMPLIFRTLRMLFSAVFFRIKCFFAKDTPWAMSRFLPFSWNTFWEEQKGNKERLVWTGPAYAVRVPGIRRFTPLRVVITSTAIHLLYKRWFRLQKHFLSLDEVEEQKRFPGALLSRWLLRTSRGDWLFSLYQPLSKTLPEDLRANPRSEAYAVTR